MKSFINYINCNIDIWFIPYNNMIIKIDLYFTIII